METTKTSKGLHIGLWIAQALIALTLLWGSFAKLLLPVEETAKMMPWALDHPGLAKFTGFVDLLGGLWIILPSALRIQPKLTVFASYGVIALMISASAFHISRGETSLVGMNIFFLILAVFVAWGRNKKAPILEK